MTPFRPADRATVTIAATTAGGATRQPIGTGGGTANHVRVFNAGGVTAFVRFGDASVQASTADIPVVAGSVEIFDAGAATHVDAVMASGTGNVSATPGKGL